MQLCDAHCHYQFAEVPYQAVEKARELGVGWAMVNGSAPIDWAEVAGLGQRDARNLCSFGLHPWDVPTAPVGWATELKNYLEKYPDASIGEMGLDQWVEGYDLPSQVIAFKAQWDLAVALERPVTIHCIRATGPLMELLRASAPLARGFLLHSWNGPRELVPELVKHGAYFSYSAYHFAANKQSVREQFAGVIPLERILIETDAPALCPAPEDCLLKLPPGEDGKPANHPANLVKVNESLARTMQKSPAETAQLTAGNFSRLFRRR
jgi:TatD DNase family protein